MRATDEASVEGWCLRLQKKNCQRYYRSLLMSADDYGYWQSLVLKAADVSSLRGLLMKESCWWLMQVMLLMRVIDKFSNKKCSWRLLIWVNDESCLLIHCSGNEASVDVFVRRLICQNYQMVVKKTVKYALKNFQFIKLQTERFFIVMPP